MKKWSKQLISLIAVLALSMQLGLCALAANATDTDTAALNMTNATATVTTKTTSSLESAISYLRSQMKARATTVRISFPFFNYSALDISQSTLEDAEGMLAQMILQGALQHTGDPAEGDSLYLDLGDTSYFCDVTDTAMVIEYDLEYHTTLKQETALNAEITKIAKQLNLSSGTDYQKVQRIYDYICQNVTYDTAHEKDATYTLQYTPYAAVFNKTAVCEGYALLFYRLALTAGVDCRVAEGEGHSWNIVKLEDMYYCLDATWDAGKSSSEYENFLQGTHQFAQNNEHLMNRAATNWRNVEVMLRYPLAYEQYKEGATDVVQDPAQVLLQQMTTQAVQQGMQRGLEVLLGG